MGAGAVVSRDIPDYALAYGCPAKIQGYVCRCGNRLAFREEHACCQICGENYTMQDGTVVLVDDASS